MDRHLQKLNINARFETELDKSMQLGFVSLAIFYLVNILPICSKQRIISLDYYDKILKAISEIPLLRIKYGFKYFPVKNKKVNDQIDVIPVLIKMKSNLQRIKVMDTFQFLVDKGFIAIYSGYHDAQIIEKFAKSFLRKKDTYPLLQKKREEDNVKIIESLAAIEATEREMWFSMLFPYAKKKMQIKEVLVITPVNGALKITKLSYPRSMIIDSLAQVKQMESNDLIDLVNRFQIKQHGECYTALIIKEISSRNFIIEQQPQWHVIWETEESSTSKLETEELILAFREGLGSFVPYLLVIDNQCSVKNI